MCINGINVSADGKLLYVSATVKGILHVYERNIATHDIALKEKLEFHTGLDNIEIDPAGRLYIGAHPKLWMPFWVIVILLFSGLISF